MRALTVIIIVAIAGVGGWLLWRRFFQENGNGFTSVDGPPPLPDDGAPPRTGPKLIDFSRILDRNAGVFSDLNLRLDPAAAELERQRLEFFETTPGSSLTLPTPGSTSPGSFEPVVPTTTTINDPRSGVGGNCGGFGQFSCEELAAGGGGSGF